MSLFIIKKRHLIGMTEQYPSVTRSTFALLQLYHSSKKIVPKYLRMTVGILLNFSLRH